MTVTDTSTIIAYSNGPESAPQNPVLTNDDAPYDSESDLSDTGNPVVDALSPATSANHEVEFGQSPESSDAEVHDESEDADFDMEESPAPVVEREDRSTSAESRRPAKRKLAAEDDPHILANPELYGLRRSVCFTLNTVRLYRSDTLCRAGQYNNDQW